MTKCPSELSLARYLNETLAEAERSSIEVHVNECKLCQERLVQLTDDPVLSHWQKLQDAQPNEANSSSVLLAKVLHLENSKTQSFDPNTDLSFGTPTDAPLDIPGYQIEELIGRGGMGVVYRAKQVSLNRVVAIKMILSMKSQLPEKSARFQAEAAAVAKLRHPNIVQVFDYGESHGQPWLCMEYLPGKSLAEYLKTESISTTQAVKLVEILARAIASAHHASIIHRDLKPANILLTDAVATPLGMNSIGDCVPKIVDFGLAKSVDDSATTTTHGVLAGTPSYMAPEQARADRIQPTSAIDIYALGVILYEILTGRTPFRGETIYDTLMAVVHQEPVPPIQLQPSIGRDLNTICLKCLEKEPHRRYAHALDLAEDLSRLQAGRPILARPTGWLARAWKWTRRNPGPAILAGGLLITLSGGILTSSYFAWEADRRAAATLSAYEEVRLAKRQSDQIASELRFDTAHLEAQRGAIDSALGIFLHSLYHTPVEQQAHRQLLLRNFASWSRHLTTLTRYDRVDRKAISYAFINSGDGAFLCQRPNGLFRVESRTGQLIPHSNVTTSVGESWQQFSEDGKLLIRRATESTLAIVDCQTGQIVGPAISLATSLQDANITHCFVDFGANESCVVLLAACEHDDQMAVTVWDRHTGAKLLGPKVLGRAFDIPIVTATLTGRRVLLIFPLSEDRGRVRCYDLATGQQESTLPALYDSDRIIGPDGQSLVVSSWIAAIGRWDRTSGSSIQPVRRFAKDVAIGTYRLGSFAGDGRFYSVMDTDSRQRFYDVETNHADGPITSTMNGGFVHNTIGRDGSFFAYGRPDNSLSQFWEPGEWLSTLNTRFAVAPEHARYTQVAVNSSRNVAFVGTDDDESAHLVDLTTALPIGRPLGGPCHYPVFSPDGRYVAAATFPKTGRQPVVQVWDTSSGMPIGPPIRPLQFVHSLGFSHDSRTLAIGCVGHVRLIEIPTQQVKLVRAIGGPVRRLQFGPDDTSLILGCRPGWNGSQPGVHVWELAQPRTSAPYFAMPEAPIITTTSNCAWAITELDGNLSAIDPVKGTSLQDMQTLFPGRQARRVVFSQDGSAVAVSLNDDRLVVYRTTAASAPQEFPRIHPVQQMQFNTQNTLLAVAYTNGSVAIWDRETRKPIGPIYSFSLPIIDLHFRATDSEVVVLFENGTSELIRIVEAAPDDPDKLRLWLSVATGMNPSKTSSTALTPEEWAAAKSALNEFSPTKGVFDRVARYTQHLRHAERAGATRSQETLLERLLAHEPQKYAFLAKRAVLRLAQQRWAEADVDLQMIEKNGGSTLNILRHTAERLSRAEQTAAATQVWQRILRHPQADARDHADRAEFALALGDTTTMVQHYRTCLQVSGDDSLVVRKLQSVVQADQWKTAAHILSVLHENRLPTVDISYQYAIALLAGNNSTEYKKLCMRLREHFNHYPMADDRVEAAWIFALQADAIRDGAEPIRWVEEALEKLRHQPNPNPRQIHAWHNTLGVLQVRAGRYQEGLASLETGLRAAPDQVDVTDYLFAARAAEELGNTDLAKSYRAKLAEVRESNSDAWSRAEKRIFLEENRGSNNR